MKTLTIDIETTMNGNEESGKGHPMNLDNDIVAMGYKLQNSPIQIVFKPTHMELSLHEEVDFVVGHNLGFDLRYLYRSYPRQRFFAKTRLWDTQLAEYLLTAQQHRWASLGELIEKYGYPIPKDEDVKRHFESGKGADSLPKEVLIEYLKNDVASTEAVALEQMTKAVTEGMFPLILTQMEALQATIEMSFNGLRVDTEFLADYSKDILTKKDVVFNNIKKILGPKELDIDSNQQVSRYFFGGVERYQVREVVGTYKNGKTKHKLMDKTRTIKGIYMGKVQPSWKTKLGISVNDEVLSALTHHSETATLATQLLQYRELAKNHSTYCVGLEKQLLHKKIELFTEEEKEEGTTTCAPYIYGNINHCATVTGRLSSTSPNLQNISSNQIKKIFISRFKNGRLVEFDFSQLEVVALAHIARDKQLIKDIVEGADIHSELYKDMYGDYPSKEDRKWFKRLTFGLLYGAGINTLSKNAGCKPEVAEKFVKTFYTRYSDVQTYHNTIIEEADKKGSIIKDKDGRFHDDKRSFLYKTETGRRYFFTEYEIESEWARLAKGRKYSFSPTELKNYPVQGLATGDIVPMMLGILFRKITCNDNWRDKALLVNTIHDSVLFDVQEDVIDNFVKEVKEILDNTHVYFEKTFKKPLMLPMKAGCTVGETWWDMEDYSSIKEH